MENPVVVFVLKDQCGDPDRQFPIGWTEAGECLEGVDAIASKECCVILLEDNKALLECCHANKDTTQPLPLVIHNSSKLYSKKEICAGSPNEEVKKLQKWGTLSVCGEFSHSDEMQHKDPIFLEIKALFRGSKAATEFAQKYRGAHEFEALDTLAALCQIYIINSAGSEDDAQWKTSLGKLKDRSFARSLFKLTTWDERLKSIVSRANSMSAEV